MLLGIYNALYSKNLVNADTCRYPNKCKTTKESFYKPLWPFCVFSRKCFFLVLLLQWYWVIVVSTTVSFCFVFLHIYGYTIGEPPRSKLVNLHVLSWFPLSISFWEKDNAININVVIVFDMIIIKLLTIPIVIKISKNQG